MTKPVAVTPPSADTTALQLCLPPPLVAEQTLAWLRQDAPSFDAGAVAVGNAPVTATLYAKSPLVLAGFPYFEAVFTHLSCTVKVVVPEGSTVNPQAVGEKLPLATVAGPASHVLLGERTALNALAECSSVATAAAAASSAARSCGWSGRVAGTRKTAPGLRVLQKYGMVVGGMDTHRVDLSGMPMIKDNHIKAAGNIGKAVAAARRVSGFSKKIDVEAEDETEAIAACEAGADVVMLDNFEPTEFRRVAALLKKRWPHVLIEASGGVTIETISRYCVPEADVISFSVNRYARAVDISLKIDDIPASS